MIVLALDPGPDKTGWVVFGGGAVHSAGVLANHDMLSKVGLAGHTTADALAIEMVASYGMPVGREIFETVWWTGRFTQAWARPDDVRLIYRRDVKIEMCGTARAKDSNVRQALIDRLGKPGTKRRPGPTYGVSGDMWSALGVAVVAALDLGEPAGLEAA